MNNTMNILVLNGSPKGERSNTLKITSSFIEGLNQVNDYRVDMVHINKANISPCLGCFNCWTKTPGQCIIKDDMTDLLDKYIHADLIIWSFPLYYFGMPSKIKAFLDRTLPTNLPFMTVRADGISSGHPSRYDLSHQRHILISTCGFYSTQKNYDALFKQFEIMFPENFTKIICPEGELLRVPQLNDRTSSYLSIVKNAGIEYAHNGNFSQQTSSELAQLLYPPQSFIEMADASWEINEPQTNDKPQDNSYNFMRQMAAVYNPAAWPGKEVVIEFFFSDINKSYQLQLTQEKCLLKTAGFASYTTRIETPFALWLEISEGHVNGVEAMMKKQYKVLGNFDTMLKMGEYFGQHKPVSQPKNLKVPKTNMTIMLLPWMIIWILVPINPLIGGICGILFSSLVPLLGSRYKLTVYEAITIALVSGFGIMALLNVNAAFVICLSYLFFGLLWLLSTLTKIPLTAHYSSNSFKGENILSNPLFIKTNLILTLLWGALYLIISTYSFFLMNTIFFHYLGLINSIAPALMGVFTVWFAKWYPAKVARG